MEARFSAPVQTDPEANPASCTMGTGFFPGVKSGRGVTLSPHSLLVHWSTKSRAIPLLPLRAVRPVQSLSVCTRAHFTFIFRLISKARVQPKVRSCEICGEQSANGKGFSPSTSVFPCHYHCTNAPYSSVRCS